MWYEYVFFVSGCGMGFRCAIYIFICREIPCCGNTLIVHLADYIPRTPI